MRPRQSLKIRRDLKALRQQKDFAPACRILETLKAKGFQTVLAGGCVRDSLLGQVPKDLDLATAAPPDVVEQSFANTLAVGKAFGTIVVTDAGHSFEVTTFRRDGPYVDGRHPSHVEFSDMKEDALRRDFTVNALFYDPITSEIYDFVGGLEDLSLAHLRTVGLPEERFHEDRLRMLRAVRFVAQLGFDLDEAALAAIQAEHSEIGKVSAERIFNEMRRLLESPFLSSGLQVLRESKLETDLWPEMRSVKIERLARFTPLNGWQNAFAAVSLLGGVSDVEPRLRAWKAPREALRHIEAQMRGCKTLMNPASTRAERSRILGGEEFAEVLLLVQGFLSGNVSVIQSWIADYLEVASETGKLPPPLVTGHDLLAMGIEPGEKMGQLLRAIYDEQLEGNLSDKDRALSELKKHI